MDTRTANETSQGGAIAREGARRFRCADLFCCAGGAAMGLHHAGFDVEGWDIVPQKRYPFTFHLGDALEADLTGFDFVWASPPCQAHTALRKMWNARHHADLIPQTRRLLRDSGLPYVIENVCGAPLIDPITLCGSMFGLETPCGAELRRHRLFESNLALMAPPCSHGKKVCGVYGGHVRDRCRTITVTGSTPQQNVVRNRIRETFTVDSARAAMGIDWMTMKELSQAIPPAYSEFLGRQIISHLCRAKP